MNRLCAALCLTAGLAQAQPLVSEIVFEGNEVTRESVLLRELSVTVGEPADPARIEHSRQAIQDLGLFRSVAVREEPTASGVRLVFTVEEKFYLLPLPRLSANLDGQYAYGLQLRWNNVAGLNHSLVIFAQQQDRQQRGIGREENYAASWFAPYVLDERTSFGASVAYTERPVQTEDGSGEYLERLRGAGFGFTYQLTPGPSNRGWNIGPSLSWQSQATSGPLAPKADGLATALGLGLGYRDIRFRIFSEVGQSFGIRTDVATEGWLSDYDFTRATTGYARYLQLGQTEHQTLHLFAELGSFHGGPRPGNQKAFDLGGSGALRAFDNDFIEGDAFYRLAVEVARPVWRPWLRAVVILEAGNVFEDAQAARLGRVYSSLGLGVRLRIPQFVNLEVELGWAIPLNGPGNGRVFGGKV
jgi:outer membrane protein assembly factor BamA